MNKFLFFLFWIHELVAFYFTDKEPSHDRLRLGRSSIREGDRNVEAASIAHSRNRIECRYSALILPEDLNKATIIAVRQLEPICARWRDSPGNLDTLTERELPIDSSHPHALPGV